MNKELQRHEFFRDKFILLFNMIMVVVSFWLHVTFINETYIFLIPIYLFGILGIFELWYIFKKELKAVGEEK